MYTRRGGLIHFYGGDMSKVIEGVVTCRRQRFCFMHVHEGFMPADTC